MKINEKGILTELTVENISIIPKMHETDTGLVRGGMFVCLPNFDGPTEPFALRHGEYRITPAIDTMYYEKILTGNEAHPWGKIKTTSLYSDSVTLTPLGTFHELALSVTIEALEDSKLLPGIHPYFTTQGSFSITVGETTITDTDFVANKLQILDSKIEDDGKSYARLTLEKKIILITAWSENSAGDKREQQFGIWSDNPAEYICIEPIFRIRNKEEVEPYILRKGNIVTIRSTIATTLF